jgi:hypothetical protein
MSFIRKVKTVDSDRTAQTDKLPALYVVMLESPGTPSYLPGDEASGGWEELLHVNSIYKVWYDPNVEE